MRSPRITRVVVDAQNIHIHVADCDQVALRLTEAEPCEADGARRVQASLSTATVTLPRSDEGRDRLYARFQLTTLAGKPIGAPVWATEISKLGARTFPMPWPKSPKGITCPVGIDDVIALGTKYLNTNVTLPAALDLGNPSPGAWWEVDGERFPINLRYFEGVDREIKRLTDAGINVTVVVNNPIPRTPDPANPFVHPASDLAGAPNHLGAFNLADRRGYRAYRAVLEFFADRYSRPDRKYGWISGYIVGNEIQQHWEWYNRGSVTPEAFLDEYAIALRVTWLALQKAHRDLRAYVSMDHHWTASMKGDAGREVRGDVVLTRLNALSKAGGDFPWHVAFHPYPENLFEPRFWRDRAATLSYDTPKITFKNLEVLPAFLNRPEQRCRGKARRIILSEQGFHAADSPDGERLQAAAYAAAYYRVSCMPGIDAFMLHRHVSHRGEGGLRLGLWTWDPQSADQSKPGRKLASWDVFRRADTPGWRDAFAFALPIVGVTDWDALEPARRIAATRPKPRLAPGVAVDLAQTLASAERKNGADWRGVDVDVAGKSVPGIFHHPNPVGDADATFRLTLPDARARPLRLHLATGFTAATTNGARFSVLLDDRVLWSAEQTDPAFVARDIDLAPWAGKSVALTLRVNGLGDITHDWCVWAEPQIRLGR